MRDQRYFLVVMDSSGRSLRRIGVSWKTVQLSVLSGLLLVMFLLSCIIHAMFSARPATQSQRIAKENREIRKVIKQLEQKLPPANAMAMRASQTFSQLWSKSGLGEEPRLAGSPQQATSPNSNEAKTRIEVEDSAELYSEDILRLQPQQLPAAFTQIETLGRELQRSLGETLEYFYDAQTLLLNTPSVRPVRTAWLSSSYGKRRDPMNGRWVMHKGLDIAGRMGTIIYAPADGIVIWTGRRGGYGITVVIDHGFGIQTHYAHLSDFLVSPGEHINRGDPIAKMGSTGKSTGPHLHYEVRSYGQPLDPRRFILD